MTVPGEMSPNVETNRRAWGVYFNASRGVATNGVGGIFSKTCRIFVCRAQIVLRVGRSLWELACLLWWFVGVHIRCCGNGGLGFRPYGGSLLQGRKSNQKVLAPPLGTSLMLGVPSLRLESVGRRDGPSLAQRGYPGVLPGYPRIQACVRPSWLTGRLRSQADQDQDLQHGGLKADLSG